MTLSTRAAGPASRALLLSCGRVQCSLRTPPLPLSPCPSRCSLPSERAGICLIRAVRASSIRTASRAATPSLDDSFPASAAAFSSSVCRVRRVRAPHSRIAPSPASGPHPRPLGSRASWLGEERRPQSRPDAAQARHVSVAASSTVSVPAAEETAREDGARVLPNLLDVLRERGLVDAVTSEDLKQAACSPLKVYVGFDPTAESLHLGNLLGIIALAWAVRCGHTAVALLGGATARVGDPSGKSVERPVLDEESIGRNTEGIRGTLEGILKRQEAAVGSAGGQVQILNNYDWWQGVSLLAFLRDVGKYSRVGTMMAKESVKKRLNSEEGMSFTEFTYQLLQGYDFVHLLREHQVTVQMGGSDQWGNITAGTDLIRRLEGGQQAQGSASGEAQGSEEAGAEEGVRPKAFGVTWPLLLKSDGTKFGKSESGAVWLSPAFLSPYKFYQYMFSMPDADVVNFLRMLTFLEISEIQQIEEDMERDGYVPNTAQRRLAEEVTRFVHGEEGLQEAIRATQALAPGAATKLDLASLEAIAEDVPSVTLPKEQVLSSQLIELAATSKLAASKAAARRLVKQGGLYLNNEKVSDEEKAIREEDLVGGRMLLLAAGKKNKMLVKIAE